MTTNTVQKLKVSQASNAAPYIFAPVQLLSRITSQLEMRNIGFWVDNESMIVDDRPEVIVINLERKASTAEVQELLDGLQE